MQIFAREYLYRILQGCNKDQYNAEFFVLTHKLFKKPLTRLKKYHLSSTTVVLDKWYRISVISMSKSLYSITHLPAGDFRHWNSVTTSECPTKVKARSGAFRSSMSHRVSGFSSLFRSSDTSIVSIEFSNGANLAFQTGEWVIDLISPTLLCWEVTEISQNLTVSSALADANNLLLCWLQSKLWIFFRWPEMYIGLSVFLESHTRISLSWLVAKICSSSYKKRVNKSINGQADAFYHVVNGIAYPKQRYLEICLPTCQL